MLGDPGFFRFREFWPGTAELLDRNFTSWYVLTCLPQSRPSTTQFQKFCGSRVYDGMRSHES